MWNPDSPEFNTVKKTIENTTIGNTPSAALDVIGCGVERAVTSGVTPTQIRETLERALTHAEQLTGGPANTGSTR
jgi:hypothetical protein